MCNASSQICWCLCIFAAISIVLVPTESHRSQEASSNAADQAITSIARSLVDPITKLKAKSVLVLDLRAPNGHLHPIGRWISERLALAIQHEVPSVQMLDRAQLSLKDEFPPGSADDAAIFQHDVKVGRSLKADALITGDFAGTAGRIGVSLSVIKVSQLDKPAVDRTGLIPLSKEITELTTDAIPSLQLEDGIPRSGKGGIGAATCVRCPRPGPVGRGSGLVKVKVTVARDGRPQSIKIVESPNYDLTAAATRAIQSWLFRPAIGFDGQLTAAVVEVEIDFRSY